MSSGTHRPFPTRPTIPVRYLAEVLDRCRPSEETVARVFEAGAIPHGALRSRRMRLSIAQWARVHEVLTRDNDDELFGFFSRPVPRGAFATLLRSLTGCVDIASALD